MRQLNTLFSKLLVLTLATSLTLWSCTKKEATEIAATTLDQEVTNSSIETAEEVQEEADKLQSDMDELEKTFSSLINARTTEDTVVTFKKCVSVSITKNTTTNTRTVTLNYGTGCTDETAANNGITISRAGKITITYSGKWNLLNTVKTLTFESFATTITKNGKTFTRTVNGTRKVTNQSTISFNNGVLSGTPKFRYENALTIKLPAIDSDHPEITVTYASDKTKTWSKGFGSLSPFDDEFTVSGTFNGINRKGVTYSAEIMEDVTVKTLCWKSLIFMPSSGKIKYTTDRGDAIVNYGDGTCDRKVTVEINGEVYEFDRDQ